ncbi:hypothetical protein VTJ04DRAFT_8801 [Mycothermus thermophilus]|uniref:uncharacterized protein n=1 Tax=Humicola insolens TaxID=85995 RepID=UPI003742BEB0
MDLSDLEAAIAKEAVTKRGDGSERTNHTLRKPQRVAVRRSSPAALPVRRRNGLGDRHQIDGHAAEKRQTMDVPAS